MSEKRKMNRKIKLKEFWKRIYINWYYCFDFAIKRTGILFTIWSIITLFTPSDELIDKELAWCVRVLLAVLIVMLIFMIVYMLGVATVFKQNRVELFDVGNNHHVYVQYGDVLSPDVLGKEVTEQKRNILISVNRCFDTIIDDNLITSNSLHGQAMKKLYATGEYTEDTLDKEIQHQLMNQPFMPVSHEDKPYGNLKRYMEGAVAEIKSSSGCVFFFLGLTCFDQLLHPYITDVEYEIALIKALQYCINRNQGYPVIIPLIGGGRSQTNKKEEDILEFLIKLIQMNQSAINCDIHIVVRESAKGSISILGLKKHKV